MRILFVLPTFNPGGAENVMIRLANHFRQYHDVQLLVIIGGGILQDNVDKNIPVHDLECERVRNSFGPLRSTILKIQPDIVFSSISRLNIILSLIKLSVRNKFRLILREVNTPSVALEATGSAGLYKFLYKTLYPRAERIICQSDDMLGEMHTLMGLDNSRLVRIYNPLNETIQALSGSIPENPYRLKTNLLSIGRLESQKGFDILLDAFTQIKKEFPEVGLTILGEGPLRAQLESNVATVGLESSVDMPGFERDVYPWIYHATGVVSPSRYEGLPNVLIESVAIGTPVVATNCPGGTAEIIQTGVNGFLTESNDVRGLVKALERLLNQPGFSSRETIIGTASKFRPRDVYEQYQALFEDVMSR